MPRCGTDQELAGISTKAQFKRRTFHVPNLIPIWVDPND